jgi:hypothetical protein
MPEGAKAIAATAAICSSRVIARNSSEYGSIRNQYSQKLQKHPPPGPLFTQSSL